MTSGYKRNSKKLYIFSIIYALNAMKIQTMITYYIKMNVSAIWKDF